MKDNMFTGILKFLRRQKEKQQINPELTRILKEVRGVLGPEPELKTQKGPDKTVSKHLNSLRYCVRWAMRGGYALDLTTKKILSEGSKEIHRTPHSNTINWRAEQAIDSLKSKFGFENDLDRIPKEYRDLAEKFPMLRREIPQKGMI